MGNHAADGWLAGPLEPGAQVRSPNRSRSRNVAHLLEADEGPRTHYRYRMVCGYAMPDASTDVVGLEDCLRCVDVARRRARAG